MSICNVMPSTVSLDDDDHTAWFLTQLSVPASQWFTEATQSAANAPFDESKFMTSWSAAGRKLGKAPLPAIDAELPVGESPVAESTSTKPPWAADECGRAILLVSALRSQPHAAHLPFVERLFHTGELREQQAVLKALPYLPDPVRFSSIAAAAIRHNSLSIIEAIACDNSFTERHLTDEAFHQMIVKALMNGIPLQHVRGLRERTTDELRRMVTAFVSERQAAGRPVPADVNLILSSMNTGHTATPGNTGPTDPA